MLSGFLHSRARLLARPLLLAGAFADSELILIGDFSPCEIPCGVRSSDKADFPIGVMLTQWHLGCFDTKEGLVDYYYLGFIFLDMYAL